MPEDHEAVVVNHVGLCVTDLDRSIRFYEDVLGFEVERRLDLPDEAVSDFLGIDSPVNATAVYLRRGPFVLELLHFARPGNPPTRARAFNEPGLTHISLSVEDLEASIALAVELGGTVVSRVGPLAAMVRDPDGQIFELLPMSYRDSLG